MKPLLHWRLVREPAVTAATGYSRATIRRLAAAGEFPRPLKLGKGTSGAVAWRESEIDRWVACREAGIDWTPPPPPQIAA